MAPRDAGRDVARALELLARATRASLGGGTKTTTAARLLVDLRAALDELIGRTGPLALDVLPEHFAFHDRPVREGDPDASLAGPLAREGLRRIALARGLTAEELEVFVAALARGLAYTGFGEDTASLLSHQELPHVRLAFADDPGPPASAVAGALGATFGDGAPLGPRAALDLIPAGPCHPVRSLRLMPAYAAEILAELKAEDEADTTARALEVLLAVAGDHLSVDARSALVHGLRGRYQAALARGHATRAITAVLDRLGAEPPPVAPENLPTRPPPLPKARRPSSPEPAADCEPTVRLDHAELTARRGDRTRSEASRPAQATSAAPRRRPTTSENERPALGAEAFGRLIAAAQTIEPRLTAMGGRALAASPFDVRPIRAVEDLVDLAQSFAEELLRFAALPAPRPSPAAEAASTTVLAVCLAYALGVGRRDLLDLGLAALLGPLGLDEDRGGDLLARLADEAPGTPSSDRRVVLVGDLLERTPHGAASPVLARILRVASTYTRRVTRGAEAPLDVLSALVHTRSGALDPRIVDLLLMILRAFPIGTHAVLESGEPVQVARDGARWDRPEVESTAHAGRTVDLMAEEGSRFIESISGTARFFGLLPRPRPPTPLPAPVDGPRPSIARETIGAKEAVKRVKLPWVERRRGPKPSDD